jgi:hypothetical protein
MVCIPGLVPHPFFKNGPVFMTQSEAKEEISAEMLEQVRRDTSPLIGPRLKRRIRSTASTFPAIYIPMRRFRRSDTVVGQSTEFLLEGYPRCGNTWAEMAIRHAAPRSLKMAHHSHAAAHVIHGLKLNVPTLVLYRDPDLAVRSLLAMNARNMTAGDAFHEYVRFYSTVLKLPRKKLSFASFEDVTQRIEQVIVHLRDKFGLPLTPFNANDPKEKAAVFARMDARAAEIRSDRQAVSRSNPNHFDEEQAAAKRIAQEQIDAMKGSPLYHEAKTLYTQMISDIQ